MNLQLDCKHNKLQKDAVVTQHHKIVHKIYTKMRTLIKSTYEVLDHENFHATVVIVMREVRKYSRLSGMEKKWLVIQIMTLLLDSLGVPPVVSHYSAEIIASQIETAYTLGLHKYKRTHRHCVLL